jgi:hypothetical protein
MTDANQSAKKPSERQWGAMRLTTGFYLADIVGSVLLVGNTRESQAAVRRVYNLLQEACTDEHQWREAIDTLSRLCSEHPDAHRQSGSWSDGDATLMSMALAMEAARAALYNLYPTLYEEGRVEGCVFKMFKYLLRTMAQNPNPDSAVYCLQWIERTMSLQPVPTASR